MITANEAIRRRCQAGAPRGAVAGFESVAAISLEINVCEDAEISFPHPNGEADVHYGSSHGDAAWHRMSGMRAVGAF